MSTFSLQIVTPDGEHYDGHAEKLIVRTITGDVCILPRHCDYVTALGMGEAKVWFEGGAARAAACIGGMLIVAGNAVKLIPTTFEWADEIDVERAKASLTRAEKMLADPACDEQTKQYANARMKRAQFRLGIAGKK